VKKVLVQEGMLSERSNRWTEFFIYGEKLSESFVED